MCYQNMERVGLYTIAVVCLKLLYTTDLVNSCYRLSSFDNGLGNICYKNTFLVPFPSGKSCNVEIVATANSTNITSPGYPDQVYPDNLTCWWRVVAADSDNNVILKIVDLSIEPSVNCTHDSLTFFDGPNSTILRSSTVCGTRRGTFISSNSSVFIQFKTDSSRGFKGFLLKVIETPKCGGEFTATPSSSTLMSTGYPDQYFNNMRCTWVITAEDEDDTVVLDFEPSIIEDSYRCKHDSVTVYNGNTTKSENTLGTFCGNDTRSFQSSNRQLKIVFITNEAVVKSGFRMSFKSVPAYYCNMTLFAGFSWMFFTSPGYPDGVYADMLCVWTIQSLNQGRILLRTLTVDIEDTIDCSNASVTVYSGYNISTELGSFCGKTTPLYRSNSLMSVVFKTSEDAHGNGFRIGYRSVEIPPTPPSADCGSNLTAVTAPRYLQITLTDKIYCSWSFQASSSAMMVRIVVKRTYIPPLGIDKCGQSYIYALDGTPGDSTSLLDWCGNTAPTLQSSQQFMFLQVFREMNKLVYFNLEYFETSEPYCGGSLTVGSKGTTLTSPGNSYYYMAHLNCVWTILTNYTNIKVDIQESSIGFDRTCKYDYLKVKDGSSNSSQVLGLSCLGETPTYITSGQYVTIIFHTKRSKLLHGGFSLEYTGGTFPPCVEQDLDADLDDWKNITSPNYPFQYPRNADCTWRLDTGDFSRLYLSIKVLISNIRYSEDCDSNYVEAFDGYDDSSTSLGRWCGSDKPTKSSSGRYMFIRFHTDSSSTETGFKISYQAKYESPFSASAGIIVGGIFGTGCGIYVLIVMGTYIHSCVKSKCSKKNNSIHRVSGELTTQL